MGHALKIHDVAHACLMNSMSSSSAVAMGANILESFCVRLIDKKYPRSTKCTVIKGGFSLNMTVKNLM